MSDVKDRIAAAGHILVVDDNEMNRDMLRRRLQRRGHVIDEAEHGQQALEMVSAASYDLVILDPRRGGAGWHGRTGSARA